jgi:hypothetical protein
VSGFGCVVGSQLSRWKPAAFAVDSVDGRLAVIIAKSDPTKPLGWSWEPIVFPAEFEQWRHERPHWGWKSQLPKTLMPTQVVFPHWFPALLAAVLAASPWIKWRFSVRTLLIGMTIIAAILGLAVATN